MFSLRNKKIVFELSSIPPLVSVGHVFFGFLDCILKKVMIITTKSKQLCSS